MPTSVPGYAEEERNGVANITHNELDGEGRIVDIEISPPPSKKSIS